MIDGNLVMANKWYGDKEMPEPKKKNTDEEVREVIENLKPIKDLEVKMEKFKKMLKELQELDIIQNSGSWEDHIPKKLWDDYFAESEFKEVKWNIDVDTHRWYETSITVIKIFGGLLGICYITNLFSESSDHEDCFHKIRFYEMEEIQTISYKRKD